MRWVIITFLIFSSFVMASLQASLILPKDEIMFAQMRDNLLDICAENGTFQFNTIYKIQDGANVMPFNCNAHLMALKDTFDAMVARKNDAFETGKLCTIANQDNPTDTSADIIEQIQPALEEVNTCEPKSSDLVCSGAFMCAMVTGPFNKLVKKVHFDGHKINEVLNQCGDMKTYECLGAALSGVWDNLSISAEAVWKLLGMMKDGVAWTGKKMYKYTIGSVIGFFSKAEEITSDKLLVASTMEPSLWQQLKSDPLKVSKELAAGFFKVLTEGIKSHYGCEKWSGIPFASKCDIPMKDWDCATCNQKMNSICGVLGFAGGELLVAYLTGGATLAAKKVVQYSYKGGSALVNRVLRPLKAYRLSIHSKTANAVIDTTAQVTGDVAVHAYKVGMRMKISDFLNAAGRLSYKAGSKVLTSKAFRVVAKSTKTVLTPLRKYIQLTDWAFMRGYGQVGRAFQSVESKMLPNVAKFVKTYQASNPKFVSYISDVEVGINIKTYGSYVASFDRGNRGRDENMDKSDKN